MAFLVGLLRLSLYGSLLAGALLLSLACLRRRVSKAVAYYLWLPVLLRLCVPLGVTLSLPVLPTNPAAPAAPVVSADPPPSGGAAPSSLPAEGSEDVWSAAPSLPAPTQSPQASAPDWSVPLTALWGAGALASLAWHTGSYLSLSKRVKRNALPPSPQALAVLRELDPAGRVALAECPLVGSPMLLGAVRPLIVLPMGIEGRERLSDVLAHELTHARRHDLLYKWFVATVTSLHWFHPLMILVRREIGRACELSCDEAVLRGLDDEGRRHYGQTLLDLAAASPSRPGLLSVTLCEEKARLKERLIAIMEHRKKGAAAAALSLLLILAVGGCAAVSALELAPAQTDSAAEPAPVQTDSTTGPEETPASSPEDSAPTPAYLPKDVPEDFRRILLGKGSFIHLHDAAHPYDIGAQSAEDISTLPALFSPNSHYAQVWAYTVVDLDGDGEEELVLQIIDLAGDMGGFELLRRAEDGQVYGYPVSYKTISELKTDGTFSWSSPTGYEWGIGSFAFVAQGYEIRSSLSGSTQDGWATVAYQVDGQSATEEEYRAAETLQSAKPNVQWANVPYQPETRCSRKTLQHIDVDGDGLEDTAIAYSYWDIMDGDRGNTTLYIHLGTGDVLEKQWEAAWLDLLAAPLTAPDRDAIVLERADLTSNYGAADLYVLEVIDGVLVESLTLDWQAQERQELILVSGSTLGEPEDGGLYSLRVPTLVDKWSEPEWYVFRWTPDGWTHELDG